MAIRLMVDPKHPGQATTQFMEIPAVGKNGGKPLPTFLQNLLGVTNGVQLISGTQRFSKS